jgi:hypothetical protein
MPFVLTFRQEPIDLRKSSYILPGRWLVSNFAGTPTVRQEVEAPVDIGVSARDEQ